MKTPQTDDLARGNHVVPTEWAEQLERERDEAREKYDDLATEHMLAINKICNERDEARQRASDLALGVKVADCIWDYGKYSVALREAKIKARYLQELTRAAYDEVEKLEDEE